MGRAVGLRGVVRCRLGHRREQARAGRVRRCRWELAAVQQHQYVRFACAWTLAPLLALRGARYRSRGSQRWRRGAGWGSVGAASVLREQGSLLAWGWVGERTPAPPLVR